MPEECHPKNVELQVIEIAWMQVNISIEKIKVKTTATEKYISNMLNKIAAYYQ